MMQSCASAAKLRGSGPNLHSGFESHGFDVGVTATIFGFISRPRMGCRVACLLLFQRTAAHDAGRKMMPGGTSPLVARRQSAISSLRANATIMVFRVLARLSAVRAANHCARALPFWNLTKRQANWIMPHRTRALRARKLAPGVFRSFVRRAGETGVAGDRFVIAPAARERTSSHKHVRRLDTHPENPRNQGEP